MNILHLIDGLTKLANKRKLTYKELKNVNDGYKEISNISYTLNKDMLDVENFDCNTLNIEPLKLEIGKLNNQLKIKPKPLLGRMF